MKNHKRKNLRLHLEITIKKTTMKKNMKNHKRKNLRPHLMMIMKKTIMKN